MLDFLDEYCDEYEPVVCILKTKEDLLKLGYTKDNDKFYIQDSPYCFRKNKLALLGKTIQGKIIIGKKGFSVVRYKNYHFLAQEVAFLIKMKDL